MEPGAGTSSGSAGGRAADAGGRPDRARALLGVLMIVALANVMVFAVQRWVAVPLSIPSSSMSPVLEAGDRILVIQSHESPTRMAQDIRRGDVVVFRAPEPGRPLVVKRVVGLPGESIQARDGVIVVNRDNVLVERWLPEDERRAGSPAASSVDIPYTSLRRDELYVLGDNRDQSIDSRTFGPIDAEDVVGTAAVRFWPPSRAGQVPWR